MQKLRSLSVISLSLACLSLPLARGQVGRVADWLTHSGDPQRTGWQKFEHAINPESVKGFQLLWKLKVENEQKALYSIFEPLIVGRLITNRGFKEVAIVAGSSDNIYAVDADLGRMLWQRHFDHAADVPQTANPTWLCPGGLTATPVIPAPPTFGGRGGASAGRGPAPQAGTAPATRPAPAPPTPGRGGGAFSIRGVYVLTSDGNLHEMNLANGEDVMPPAKLVPPNGKAYSMNMVDNVVYATTGQKCGGNPNGVYAMDLASADKKVATFGTNGGGIWGLGGAAIGTDGTVYAEVGDGEWDPGKGVYSDTILALSPKDLKLKDWYTPSNREWITKRDLDMNTTPTVFPYKGRDLIVAGGKEGRLFLLDSQSLGGASHRTPLYRTPLIANEETDFAGFGIWGGLASWEDSKGTRWVLAPVWGPLTKDVKFPVTNGEAPHGSIVAFKVEEKDGKTVLAPAWVSRDLIIPAPPVVANGVVFALSSGENVRQANENQGGLFSAQQRAERSVHATLYALDAESGKELYSSGDSITSFTHFASMAVANGRVYFGTYDNTLYSFGFPIEH
jgi:outer membrane protein assembly factor BamB